VLIGIALVSLLLVGVYSLIELIREARALQGGYGLVQMLWYLAQTMPRRLYDIFPFAALIGTLLGLGGLASGNELVAMRAAGFDRRQLIIRVLAGVSLCLLILMLLSELAIPGLEAKARSERQQARTGQVHLGGHGDLWLRDGGQIVRIGYSAWLGEAHIEFGELLIYRLDADMQPQE
jgi:lipopolysaccharide export system permease protein